MDLMQLGAKPLAPSKPLDLKALGAKPLPPPGDGMAPSMTPSLQAESDALRQNLPSLNPGKMVTPLLPEGMDLEAYDAWTMSPEYRMQDDPNWQASSPEEQQQIIETLGDIHTMSANKWYREFAGDSERIERQARASAGKTEGWTPKDWDHYYNKMLPLPLDTASFADENLLRQKRLVNEIVTGKPLADAPKENRKEIQEEIDAHREIMAAQGIKDPVEYVQKIESGEGAQWLPERMAKGFGKGFKKGVKSMTTGAIGAVADLAGQVGVIDKQRAVDLQSSLGVASGTELADLQSQQWQQGVEAEKNKQSPIGEFAAGALTAAAETTGQMLPAVAMGGVTGGAGAAYGGIAVQVGSDTYNQMRAEGASPIDALGESLMQASIETLTEIAGGAVAGKLGVLNPEGAFTKEGFAVVRKAFEDGGIKGLLTKAAGSMGAEGLEEVAAEVMGVMAQAIGQRDYSNLKELPFTFTVGALAGLAGHVPAVAKFLIDPSKKNRNDAGIPEAVARNMEARQALADEVNAFLADYEALKASQPTPPPGGEPPTGPTGPAGAVPGNVTPESPGPVPTQPGPAGEAVSPEQPNTEELDLDAAIAAEMEAAEQAESNVPKTETQAEASPQGEVAKDYGTVDAPNRVTLGEHFGKMLSDGGKFGSINEARKEAGRLLGGEVKPGSPATKDVDEAVEQGVVRAARQIIAAGKGQEETFDALVDLYGRQPNLSSRTSTSMVEQAYSTPAPLAYIAQQLTGTDGTAWDSSAGNGMLLSGHDPAKAFANELNPKRAESLRGQGLNVTEGDATEINTVTSGQQYDAVIINPPFGRVEREGKTQHWVVDGVRTEQIDHAITLKSLQAMKPDGKATVIIGAKGFATGEPREDMKRAQSYSSQKAFYDKVYDEYNVVDHFTVHGDLYSRQGAGFPVDVIVVDGKGKSSRPKPWQFKSGGLPQVFNSWDDLKNAKLLHRTGTVSADPQGEEGTDVAGDSDASKGSDPQPGGEVGRPDRGSDAGVGGKGGKSAGASTSGADSGQSGLPGSAGKSGGSVESEKGDAAGTGRGADAGATTESDPVDDLDAAIAAEFEKEEAAEKAANQSPEDLARQRFANTAVDSAKNQDGKSREILVYMSPAEFLSLAEAGQSADKTAAVDTVIRRGDKFNSIPFLTFEHDGKGTATVVSHEGRHRARALEALGDKTMPVILQSNSSKSGNAIRWLSQDNPDSYDYFKQEWPTVLKQQEGGSGSVPFPVPDNRVKPKPKKKLGDKKKTIKTASGRDIPDYPKVREGLTNQQVKNALKHQRSWLLDQAMDEARATSDGQRMRQIQHTNVNNMPPATIADLKYFLFGESAPDDIYEHREDAPAGVKPAAKPKEPTEAPAPKPEPTAREKADAQREAVKKAMEEFKKGFLNPPATTTGIDPEQVKRAVALVREVTKLGVYEFAAFVEVAKEVMGDQLDAMAPYLESAWKYVHKNDKTGKVSPPAKIADIVAKAEVKEALQDKPLEEETEFQSTYTPRSKNTAVGTLLPTNHVAAVERALEAIEEEHGDIDAFVAKELGYTPEEVAKYFSAEQVDALAMAIANDKRGQAFIIGDQTGVGKGRIVAGMMRYAQQQGRVPVFVTEKPSLYADMIRDVTDIGMNPADGEFEPLMTNDLTGENAIDLNNQLPDERGERVVKQTTATARGMMDEAIKHFWNEDGADDGGTLKGKKKGKEVEFDAIFTTYSQLNPYRGAETWRHHALRRIMPQAYLILDESHNAGGGQKPGEDDRFDDEKPTRAELVREMVASAGNVFYSSATFAKRPEVMDLYVRAGIGTAVKDPESLPGLIAGGGVPLQQAVSEMLAEAGLYLRRERSFAGVDFAPEIVEVKKDDIEGVSSIYSAINRFSISIRDAVGQIESDVTEEGGKVGADGSIGQAGVDSMNFTSILWNLTDQMLMALKADAAAEAAIKAFKAGESPFIVVDNTMEKALDRWTDDQDTEIKPGDKIEYSFKDMLRHYLKRSREVLIKRDKSDPSTWERQYLTDEQLGPEAVLAYNEAEALVDAFDAKLPASPVDWMRHKLEAAGLTVAEITGRHNILDYSSGDMTEPKLAVRNKDETGNKGKARTVNGYNDGTIDVIIANRSGSTGLSAHASAKFIRKDGQPQKRRHMIIAQPAKNIDEFMQMLGRVHRTGQIMPPKYTLFLTNAPAENRPAAVLVKKLASLNATVTASAKGTVNFDVPDIINELGDRVVADWISERPDLNREMDYPAKYNENGQLENTENIAKKVSGRVVLLPLKTQEEFWDDIVTSFTQLVTELNAYNANPLVASKLDMDAKTLEKFEIAEGDADSKDPFAQPAFLEKVDAKNVARPLSAKQVEVAVADFYEGKGTRSEWMDEEIETLRKAMIEFRNKRRKEIEDRYANPAVKHVDTVDSALESLDNTVNGQYSLLSDVISKYAPGAVVQFMLNDEPIYGVVTGLSHKVTTGSPGAPSKWKLDIAVADAMRKLSFPVSRAMNSELALQSWTTIPPNGNFAETTVGKMFDEGQTISREERYIGTNNILSAYKALEEGHGRIVFYTNNKGETSRGVLMPKGFNPEAWLESRPVVFKTAEQVLKFLQMGGQASTADGVVILSHFGDNLVLLAPLARSRAGQYTTNDGILKAGKPHEFVKKGARMEMVVPAGRQQLATIQAVMDITAIQTNSDKALARRLEEQGMLTGIPAPRVGVEAARAVVNPVRQTRSKAARKPDDATTREIAAQDILKTWERIFKVPLRVGGSFQLSKRAAGLYYILPEVIRMGEKYVAALGVAAHEIGHHIDKDTGIGDRKRTPLSDIVQNELAGLDYEPKNRLFEGFAEFIRHYITETDAQARAPMFHRYFEKVWMKDHPEWAAKIKEAQQHARQFADQSVFKRIQSLIGNYPQDLSFSERMKRRLYSRGQQLIHEQVDKFAFLKTIGKHARKRGYAGIDAYEAISFYDMTAPSHAEKALEHGPHSLRTGQPTGKPGLWSASQYVNSKEEEKEAIAYAYARFTLFMRKLQPQYNTGMDAADALAWVTQMQKEGKAGTAKSPERYDKFADTIAEYANGLLDVMVDAGAISRDLRDKLVTMYGKNYFPLIRAQEGGGGIFAGSGFVNLPPAIFRRSAKGSGRKIIDPFDALVAMTLQRYNRAIKARSVDTVIQMLDPKRGGVEGMGWALNRVDPKRTVHRGRVHEILKTLVEEGIVYPDDARAMRIAMNIKNGLGISKNSHRWFCDRHGLDPDLATAADLQLAAENEPDAMATIALWRLDWSPSASKRTVLHYDRGETPMLYEMDDMLYQIATGSMEEELTEGWKILRMIQEPFKLGAVGLSTKFAGRNLVADYQTYQGRAKYVKGLHTLTAPPRLIARYIKAKATGKRDSLVELFDETGGKIYNILGSEPSRKRVRRKRLGKDKRIHPVDAYFSTIGKLQTAVAVSDAPPRLAEMEAAILEEGYEAGQKRTQIWNLPGGGRTVVFGDATNVVGKIQGAKKVFDGDARGKWIDMVAYKVVDGLPEHVRIKAGRAAAEATVNFKPGGTKAGRREAILPFSRAAVNAAARWFWLNANMKNALKQGTEGEQARRYMLYSALMAGQAMWYWSLRGDDDDYREEEDYNRRRFWSFDFNGDGQTDLYIPKPRDEAWIANLVEAAMDSYYYPEEAEGVGTVFGRDMLDRVPTGGGIIRGAAEVWGNWNTFKHRPIVPQYLQGKPDQLQYDNYTKEVSKWIGERTAAIGLGPMEVEHLMDSATGGAYGRWADTYEAAEEDWANKDVENLSLKHVPFLGGFFPNRRQAGSINDFYEEMGRVSMDAELDKANGLRNSPSQRKLRAMNSTADLMAAIREKEGTDYKGRRNYEYTPFLVGLSREALGRDPLESNPSPWEVKDLPAPISEAIRDTAESRARRGILGLQRPVKAREGWTLVDEDQNYQDNRRDAVRWLQDHRDHPLVKPEIEKAMADRKYPRYRYPSIKEAEEAGMSREVLAERMDAAFHDKISHWEAMGATFGSE